MKKESAIFFFIGTEAELIKVFPVMRELKKMHVPFFVIASGQNDIGKSRIFQLADCGRIDLCLNEAPERKDAFGLFCWWLRTFSSAVGKIRKVFADIDFRHSKLVIHGDTVSTLMGAEIGYHLGMRIYHIEAGLRSHRLWEPFPEEIDRLLASRRARVHFAPGKAAAENLKRAKGKVFNTRYNTLSDSLGFSENIPAGEGVSELIRGDYFVFVMHRQENLVNKSFVSAVMREVKRLAETKRCIFIRHELTGEALKKFGLLEALERDQNITMVPRLDYFDFMKVLAHSAYVITDGGSNQEELYYMGKPCLILRRRSERTEGIGENAVLFRGNVKEIREFAAHLPEGKSCLIVRKSPSEFIARVISANHR